jgi:hypothetical protein
MFFSVRSHNRCHHQVKFTGYISCRYTLLQHTKGVIRIRKLRDKQHNGQQKKDNQRPTKHTHKTKDRGTRTQLETGDELKCSGILH